MKVLALVGLMAVAASANPAKYQENHGEGRAASGLQMREMQLMTIAEGARQLGLLASEMWQYSNQVVGALPTTSDMARSLQRDDPVELMLNTIDLDSDSCRQRVVCELQSQMTGSTMGSLLYELVKSRVPQLQKYGYVSARDMGADSCSSVFSCRLSESPLMERALEVRDMAADVCDMESATFTGWMCRSTTFLIDWLESL